MNALAPDSGSSRSHDRRSSDHCRLLPKAVAFLVLAAIILAGGKTEAACNEKWKSWHDNMRGKHGVLKIKYQVCSDSEINFLVYKNKDWDGNLNTWEEIDDFTITPKKTKHKQSIPEFYRSAVGNISVTYEIKADFKKGKVHSTGSITAPEPKFPFVAKTKKWDMDFFNIPQPGNLITSKNKEGYEFVEVSEIWTGYCSNIACGPWVQFPGYSETHRYNAVLPKIGPVIIQLWKGFCPRFDKGAENSGLGGLVNLLGLGKEFPGGIGAEVGIYRPVGKNATMFDAASTPVIIPKTALTCNAGGRGLWAPLVDPNLKISFQLINPKTGEVLVDAEEKQTWWRTKWMSSKSFEAYKTKHQVPPALMKHDFTSNQFAPDEVLSYELHYTINGIKQPVWKHDECPGKYPELGFNGIWYRLNPGGPGTFDFEYIEIYRDGNELQVGMHGAPPVSMIINGNAVALSKKDKSTVRATQAQGEKEKLTLEYHFDKALILPDRTYNLELSPQNHQLTVNGLYVFEAQ